MIQLQEFLFGKNIESAIVNNEDEINFLAQYVVQKIIELKVQDLNSLNNQQAFAYKFGSVYIDTCNDIEFQFKNKSKHNYLMYKQRIEIVIAKKLRKIAKKNQYSMYQQLLSPLKQKYQKIDITLSKKKNIILLNEEYQETYAKFIQNIYQLQPKSMNWVLIKFEEQLKKKLIYQTIEIQKAITQKKYYKPIVKYYVETFLINQKFQMLNKNYVVQLIQFAYKLNKSKFQDVQLGFQKFIIELSSIQYLQLNQDDINQIFNQKDKYFFENFSAKQTMELIIELFLLLSGFKYNNQSLDIEKYQPSSHAFLLKFCQEINDGKWEFTNCCILKLADKVLGKIHYQIVQQLNEKSTNIVVLKIQNKQQQFELFRKNPQALANFKSQNQAYYFSSLYQNNDKQQKIDVILNDKFSQFMNNIVQQKPQDLKQYAKPEMFYLQSLSEGKLRSNVITIFVNGFITQSDQKVASLWPFNKDSYLETLVLGWTASSVSSLAKYAGIAAMFSTTVVGIAIQPIFLAVTCVTIKQFYDAYKEAKIVGKYLAYFLNQNYLGTKSINLVGFSLGTVIVYYCLKQLIKLQKQEKYQIIHNVLMMGGVADKDLLSKLDYRCISGTFHNVYSEQDGVLGYALPLYNNAINPCGKYQIDINLGLNSVESMYPNVKNHNFTQKVSGHRKYEGEIIQEILKLTNFDDQYLIF
ncbi:unnamed protein product (macronuclear) [Paramecium tetraurelia]|uniref:DUF726 domain-containing protein n=1 Tax=Paramecium tetraurelia TaxID=5888 RepID=A0BPR4_PARTE|nr:uncharacterized protein GSPATT00005281001 [Paramecium tetraurelia]CAK60531.1 unnamed protein product [Paramecium tetraurelia]|eukprot:XP_001427929.1 hypothetical protein (macronuclear) [Paramecium tetraurelia strain d4-2]